MARYTNTAVKAQSSSNYFIWAIETSVSGRTVTATYKIYAQGNYEPYYDWPTTVTAKVGTTTVWNAVTSPRMPAGSGHWASCSVTIGSRTYQRCYTLGSGTYTAGYAAETVSVSFSYKISGSASYLPPANTYTVSGSESLAAANFTITLNANGGSGGTTSVTIAYGTTAGNYPSITRPTRAGYTFNGYWDTSATSGGTEWYNASGNSLRTFNLTANATWYARWTANSATYQININGGAITTGTGTTRYRVSNNIVQVSSNSGSTWSNLTGTITTGTTYYDIWNVGTYGGYRSGYYFGSSTGDVGTSAYRVGSTSGTIIGQDSNTSSSTNPASLTALTGYNYVPTNGATITLYINWVAKATYTVSYNKGANGTGTNTSDTKTHGTALTLRGAIFTRTGYTQTGWATSDGGAQAYALSGSYTTNAAVTLYPVWTANNYTLTINPNGGSYNSKTTNTTATVAYQGRYDFLQGPTRSNYLFSHWTSNNFINFSQTSVTVYNNSGGGTVTHAWDTSTLTNYYVLKIVTNGTASPGAGGFYQGVTAEASHVYYQVYRAKIPTGYSLAWAGNSTGTGRTVENLTSMAGTGNWETYAFKHTAGASGTFSTFGHIYVTGSNNTSVTWYVQNAYVWDATAGTYKARFYNQHIQASAGNTTLTAQWIPLNHYVTINKGTGVASTSHSSGYYQENSTINLTATASTGYHITGGTGSFTVTGAVTKNVTAALNTYTIAFNANGGSGSMDSVPATYGTPVTLPQNAFTAPTTQYSFYGWHTAANVATRTYIDKETVSNLTTTNGATVTLYAVWQRTLTFKSGVNQATSSTTKQYRGGTKRGDVTFPAPAAISGFTALGWRDDTTAGAKEYGSSSSTVVSNYTNSSQTLYAVYSRTATLYSGIAKATTENPTQYYNSANNYSITPSAAPTAIGNSWTALGWRDDTTASTKEYGNNGTTAITGSAATYYAVYSRTITVNYAAGGGTGTMSASTNTSYYNSNGTIAGNSITLKTNTFTYDRHTFTGWSIANPAVFAVGDAASRTATAQWRWTKTARYYTGSAISTAYYPYVWNGSSWVLGTAYVWNGSAWKQGQE